MRELVICYNQTKGESSIVNLQYLVRNVNELTNKCDIVFFCNDKGYQLNFHQTILHFYGQELFEFNQFSTT